MTRKEFEECGKAFADGLADGVRSVKNHCGSIGKDDFISRTALIAMLNDEMNRLEERKRELEYQNTNPIGIVLQHAECNYLIEIVKGMQGVKTGLENLIWQLENHYNIIQSGENQSAIYESRTPVFQRDYDTSINLKSVIDILEGWLNNE